MGKRADARVEELTRQLAAWTRLAEMAAEQLRLAQEQRGAIEDELSDIMTGRRKVN